ncbi:unnamed protein product [Heterobilharzia americana]|nr:unnamed protein product [Heterobilharzia americana]CAH8663601.1 unnamed protein product [Heterobilharzia americana]
MENSLFVGLNNEAEYWRQKAEEYRKGMEEVREEFEEFRTSSQELEQELETHLRQLEVRNKELVVLCEKLTVEKEKYQNQVEINKRNVNHEITRLQDELEKSKVDQEKMHKYIRELEQLNDDLERSKRATVVTLEDFESRLNQSIERNAFLENELDEKEDLVVTVQRLKDETRDLHQELAIARRQVESIPTQEMNSGSNPRPKKTTSRSAKDSEVQTDISYLRDSVIPLPARLCAKKLVNNVLQTIEKVELNLSILYRIYNENPPPIPADRLHLLSRPSDS